MELEMLEERSAIALCLRGWAAFCIARRATSAILHKATRFLFCTAVMLSCNCRAAAHRCRAGCDRWCPLPDSHAPWLLAPCPPHRQSASSSSAATRASCSRGARRPLRRAWQPRRSWRLARPRGVARC
jgi:hypothetical protein